MKSINIEFVGIISVIVAVIAGFFIYQYPIQKKITTDKITEHLESKGINLEEDIKSFVTVYDSKVGEYYVEVIYKDEPKSTYGYIYRKKRNPQIFVILLDQDYPELRIRGKHSEP